MTFVGISCGLEEFSVVALANNTSIEPVGQFDATNIGEVLSRQVSRKEKGGGVDVCQTDGARILSFVRDHLQDSSTIEVVFQDSIDSTRSAELTAREILGGIFAEVKERLLDFTSKVARVFVSVDEADAEVEAQISAVTGALIEAGFVVSGVVRKNSAINAWAEGLEMGDEAEKESKPDGFPDAAANSGDSPGDEDGRNLANDGLPPNTARGRILLEAGSLGLQATSQIVISSQGKPPRSITDSFATHATSLANLRARLQLLCEEKLGRQIDPLEKLPSEAVPLFAQLDRALFREEWTEPVDVKIYDNNGNQTVVVIDEQEMLEATYGLFKDAVTQVNSHLEEAVASVSRLGLVLRKDGEDLAGADIWESATVVGAFNGNRALQRALTVSSGLGGDFRSNRIGVRFDASKASGRSAEAIGALVVGLATTRYGRHIPALENLFLPGLASCKPGEQVAAASNSLLEELEGAFAVLASAEAREKDAVKDRFSRRLAKLDKQIDDEQPESQNDLLEHLDSLAGVIVGVLSSARTSGNPLDVADWVQLGFLRAARSVDKPTQKREFPLLVPLLGQGHVLFSDEGGPIQLQLQSVALNALLGTAPGQLEIYGFDEQLDNLLSPFASINQAFPESVRSISDIRSWEVLIDELTTEMQDYAGKIPQEELTLVDYRESKSSQYGKYRILVIPQVGSGSIEPDSEVFRKTLNLLRAGRRLGFSGILSCAPGLLEAVSSKLSSDERAKVSVFHSSSGAIRWQDFTAVDPVLVPEDPTITSQSIAHFVEKARNSELPTVAFDEIEITNSGWSRSSKDGVTFSIGRTESGGSQEISLGDEREQRHNILITGAVGQGKSNLIKVVIHSLANRYSPDELQLQLLDFKEGVTLFPMAPRPGADDFLPHVRVFGLESDREFGVSVLRRLEAEFKIRSRKFKPYGDNIAKYRDAVPDAVMPRIVLVIDEFHVLFDQPDDISQEASQLLESLARKGRSYGIHLILASQTISGISALMSRESGIYAQFPIRLALKNSTTESYAILGQGNDAAAKLTSRGQVVLNLNYGAVDSNGYALVAVADDQGLAQLRKNWWHEVKDVVAKPRVFDGSKNLRLRDTVRFLAAAREQHMEKKTAPLAFCGEPIAVDEKPLSLPFGQESGRNIAVVGAGKDASFGEEDPDLAIGFMQNVALSLAVQHGPGSARFVVVDGLSDLQRDESNHDLWSQAMAGTGCSVEIHRVTKIGHVLETVVGERLNQDSDPSPLFILGFAMDRARDMDKAEGFGDTPADNLQKILKQGPQQGVHFIGWWTSSATLNSHVGYDGSSYLDCRVFFRTDKSAVQEVAGPFANWSIRDNRAFVYDRTYLAQPVTVIPYLPIDHDDLEVLATMTGESKV